MTIIALGVVLYLSLPEWNTLTPDQTVSQPLVPVQRSWTQPIRLEHWQIVLLSQLWLNPGSKHVDCLLSMGTFLGKQQQPPYDPVFQWGERRIPLKGQTARLFHQRLILPPEARINGRYSFSWVPFTLRPQHLHFSGFSLSANKTFRIKAIRAINHTGDILLLADFSGEEPGDGREFKKDKSYDFFLEASKTGRTQFGPLKTIEFLASAQDNQFQAELNLTWWMPEVILNHRGIQGVQE